MLEIFHTIASFKSFNVSSVRLSVTSLADMKIWTAIFGESPTIALSILYLDSIVSRRPRWQAEMLRTPLSRHCPSVQNPVFFSFSLALAYTSLPSTKRSTFSGVEVVSSRNDRSTERHHSGSKRKSDSEDLTSGCQALPSEQNNLRL